jgi:hypothetical protein
MNTKTLSRNYRNVKKYPHLNGNTRAYDLTGQTFGYYKVLAMAGRNPYGSVLWRCRCVCETVKDVESSYLLHNSATKNCGCKTAEISSAFHTTHGMAGTPTYRCWRQMIVRCESPKCKAYPRYGGRGITVCKRWRHSFDNFLKDVGPMPPGKWIERRDNNAGYSPDNCYWATPTEQGNNKRNNRILGSGFL